MIFSRFTGRVKRDNTFASLFSSAFKQAVEDVAKEMANRFSRTHARQAFDVDEKIVNNNNE